LGHRSPFTIAPDSTRSGRNSPRPDRFQGRV